MPKKLTTEIFILRAREVHGDRYDYSKSRYVDYKTKINIICKEHGEFLQLHSNHLNGSGCPKCCTTNHKCTTEEFIEKARKIHGNKYDYSKVDYINAKTKVCIICPEHGEFWQTPNNHLCNNKCPECSNKSRSFLQAFTTEEFIKKAREVHGNKYNYDKINYINCETKVKIICPIHGEFEQTPANHIRKKCGCPKCGNKQSADSKRKPIEYFIEKARQIHDDKYDYSKVEYKSYKDDKIEIICPEHGSFFQTMSNHLCGYGCPKCNQSHLEREIVLFLKENNIEFEEQKKFDWLGLKSLDFYLPEYNIAIECLGQQHFKPVDRFGGEDVFNQILHRDSIKLKLCLENKINLLYYTNKKVDIPENWELYNVISTKEDLLNNIIK